MMNSKTILSSIAALAIGYILISTLPSGIIHYTTPSSGEEMITLEGDEQLHSKDKVPEAEAPASEDSIIREERDESNLIKSAGNGGLSMYYFLILDFFIAIGVYLAAKRFFS
jgi:hypothetical protein